MMMGGGGGGGVGGMAGGWSAVEDEAEIERWVSKSLVEANGMKGDSAYRKVCPVPVQLKSRSGVVQVRKVLEVRQQVVAGMNYEVRILIGKTDCESPVGEDAALVAAPDAPVAAPGGVREGGLRPSTTGTARSWRRRMRVGRPASSGTSTRAGRGRRT